VPLFHLRIDYKYDFNTFTSRGAEISVLAKGTWLKGTEIGTPDLETLLERITQ
jgi:hypothetical protein